MIRRDEREGGKMVVAWADAPGDVITHVNSLPDHGHGEYPRRGYIGRVCADPWPQGLVMLREALGSIVVPIVGSVRRAGVWAESGDEFSRDRLYAGQMDCWRTTRRRAGGPPPRVRLVANTGARANLSSRGMFWRAATVVALADAMVAAGYSVEVIGATYAMTNRNPRGPGRPHPDHIATVVVAKAYSDMLVPEALLGMLAREEWHREVTFAFREAMGRHIGSSQTFDTPAERERMGLGDVPGVRTFVVDYDTTNANKARAEIDRILALLQAPAAA